MRTYSHTLTLYHSFLSIFPKHPTDAISESEFRTRATKRAILAHLNKESENTDMYDAIALNHKDNCEFYAIIGDGPEVGHGFFFVV